MLRNQRSSGGNAMFYKPADVATEIRSGYLCKSPPKKHFTSEKSWKRRFFVLFKVSEHEHQLTYFRNAEERDRPIRTIKLSDISMLKVNPQHDKWSWVQKTFKCTSDQVLQFRASNRDYLIIGESSDQVDAWFSDLFDAMKTRPHSFQDEEEESIEPQKTEPPRRIRSMSETNNMDDVIEKPQREDFSKRRASEPVNPLYDYPRPILTQKQMSEENGAAHGDKADSLYETMIHIKHNEKQAHTENHGAQEFSRGSLMRSVTQVFDKMKTQLPTFEEETEESVIDKTDLSDSCCSSSENVAISPEETLGTPNEHTVNKRSSTESPDSPEKKDVVVKQADAKTHLTLEEVDGKPCVTEWTGPPPTVCPFHKGDQILAVNDLQVSNVEEFNVFINKSLKNKVKVTVLRLPGSLPLHSSTSL